MLEREQKFGTGREDYRLAEWLALKFKGGWRFDHSTDLWHHWNGHRWAPDKTNRIAYATAQVAAKAIMDKQWAPGADFRDKDIDAVVSLLKVQPQSSTLKALASLPGVGMTGEEWDQDANLLGVDNGIVDLRNNALIVNPTSDLLVTRTTRCRFRPIQRFAQAPEAAPVFWRSMLEWTSGDVEQVNFLLLWFGASLFGMTPEQRFMLMTGIGRNGKGALKHAILNAVGEYGGQPDANMYMRTKFGAARSDSARADLIDLKGLRIAFFSEPSGNQFDDELIKAHTGGDLITARQLYSKTMQSWEPTHSITILVNRTPEIEDLGPSMGARVMVADFRESFLGGRENKQLYPELAKEAGIHIDSDGVERSGILSILAWAAKAWYDAWSSGGGGITLPQRVVEQTQRFMEKGDLIGMAIDDVFVVGPEQSCASRSAYDAYVDWQHANREEKPVSEVRFAEALERKGFTKKRTASVRQWIGLRPKGVVELADESDDEDED